MTEPTAPAAPAKSPLSRRTRVSVDVPSNSPASPTSATIDSPSSGARESATPVSTSLDPARCIRVRGAREHNLKNINVDIPRDRLVVITGLSGSGKSSLAFDTIFAEGQRKYMESLSAYARQFLDQLKKPDIDDIEGLPPTIAIEQRSGVASPRSTVATTTEIFDYLRLLYARCGSPRCWAPTKTKKDGTVTERCGKVISATCATQIVDAVMQLADGSRLMILAPVVRSQKGYHKDVLEDAQSKGWGRVRVAPGGKNPALHEIRDVLAKGGENPLVLGRYEKHSIDVVIDRIVLRPDARQRIAEGIESALKLADGTVIVAVEEAAAGESTAARESSRSDRVYSNKFSCPDHPECSLEELSPRVFSFNSPSGACPECHGLGTVQRFELDLCIPDKSLSLSEGAVKPWKVPPPMGRFFRRRLKHFSTAFGVNANTAIEDLPDWAVNILMHGATPEDEKKHRAKFEGVGPSLRSWYEKTESSFIREWLGQFMTEVSCPTCDANRLRIESLHVLLNSSHEPDEKRTASKVVIGRDAKAARTSVNIAEFSRLTITDAADYVKGLNLSEEQRVIAEPILKEVLGRLGFLASVGLEYLSLDRKTGTLSGGEAQRIRLATQVGSKLVGACYVLDEPTIGLHQRDNTRLINTLRHLADIGNTVLVVEHDEEMIRSADWVLDIGPGPGVHGGQVIASGTVHDIISTPRSLTGQYLSGNKSIVTPKRRRPLDEKDAIVVKGAKENNLRSIDASFPLGSGGLICVTGVSGSGKSTLVNDILLQAAKKDLLASRVRVGAHAKITGLKKIDRIIEVDQSPIGRTPRSNPATYTGIFDEIRRIFAATKEAKIRGYQPARFSFNVRAQKGGGRCEACEGQGLKKIEMHFLPDVYVKCEVCRGARYNRETLEVLYRGKSIADVLGLTIEQACAFFENHPKILRFVQCLRDVGLGYIELGQPSTTLSGGEAQRVKLATELGKVGSAATPSQFGVRTEDTLDADVDIDTGDTESGDTESDDEQDDVAAEASIRKGSATARGGLAARLSAPPSSRTLYILDEPTTGLHFDDVARLVDVLNRLADAGNTLVVIEHNLDVIKCADWIIDLGPEGGDRGGTIVAAGTPEQIVRVKASHTGQYLAPLLKQT